MPSAIRCVGKSSFEVMMMKRLFVLLLAMLLMIPAALAESNLYYIDGRDADRVHLRAEPSAQADSLGLYFSGTGVIVIDWYDEWAHVLIGDVEGYMMSKFLTGSESACAGPWKMVDNPSSTWVNLRERPHMYADVLSFPDNGLTVRVLGETTDGWSYVECEGIKGYVHTELLSTVKLQTTLVADMGTKGYIHRCTAPNGQELYFNARAEEPGIEIKDVNFDGLDDLVIITGRWAKCDTALFYVYDPADGYVFVCETARDEGLMNYTLYPQYGLVGTHISNGSAGLEHENCLYRWEGNDLTCIRRAYSENYIETVWNGEMYTQNIYTDRFCCNVYDYTTGEAEGTVIYSVGPVSFDEFLDTLDAEDDALWQGIK
jgi:SH3-like domain-containing protein